MLKLLKICFDLETKRLTVFNYLPF